MEPFDNLEGGKKKKAPIRFLARSQIEKSIRFPCVMNIKTEDDESAKQ